LNPRRAAGMLDVSLNEYLRKCLEEIQDKCTGCGECVANCEINPFTALRETDPTRLGTAKRDFLVSGEFDQEVYDFAFQCINCLECDVHCPEGITASATPVLAKARFAREGHPLPPMLELARPCKRYSYQDVLSAIQTTPAEKWWLEEIPETPDPHEIVVFFGCHDLIFPSAMAATRDILNEMGEDFVSLGGGKSLCCGAVHLNTADPETADRMCRELVAGLERFRPSTVLFTCPTCVYVLEKASREHSEGRVRYQHLSKFLAERMDRLAFKKCVRKRFTVQDPCFTARGLGDYESPRQVLSAIEGVELIEMEHTRERALCCGWSAKGNPDPAVPEAFMMNRVREAKVADADAIVNLCAGCQLAFFPYEEKTGVESFPFPEVVAQALGICVAEDKMKRFHGLGDPARVLEAAREAVEASDYTAEEVAAVLSVLF
jgi:Fe-S oxidoreductase